MKFSSGNCEFVVSRMEITCDLRSLIKNDQSLEEELQFRKLLPNSTTANDGTFLFHDTLCPKVEYLRELILT